jgi:hypothetical protein
MPRFLRDERGHPSSARLSLWATLLFTFWLIGTGRERAPEVWDLLKEVLLVLGGWAGGPRIMQYISQLRSSAPNVVSTSEVPPPG